MQRFLFAALSVLVLSAQDRTLLGTIVAPERAYNQIPQSLTGVFAMEGRRATPPGQAPAPPVPFFFVFHSDGTLTGASASGDASFSGLWVRTGDRKFLVTYFTFNLTEAWAFASVAKIRMNTQMSEDGRSLKGSQEAVVLDRHRARRIPRDGTSVTGTAGRFRRLSTGAVGSHGGEQRSEVRSCAAYVLETQQRGARSVPPSQGKCGEVVKVDSWVEGGARCSPIT